MHVLQRAKASLPFLRKAQITRLSLVFASVLLCSTMLSLFLSAGTAHAASLGAKSANIPATSGGGCISNGVVKSCISENSSHNIVPDAYLLLNNVCNVDITLLEDGYRIASELDFGPQCFYKTHLYGTPYHAASGHNWVTIVYATSSTTVDQYTLSPYLYT